ncbi:unnamed protein product [Pylaiella littoralis]
MSAHLHRKSTALPVSHDCCSYCGPHVVPKIHQIRTRFVDVSRFFTVLCRIKPLQRYLSPVDTPCLQPYPPVQSGSASGNFGFPWLSECFVPFKKRSTTDQDLIEEYCLNIFWRSFTVRTCLSTYYTGHTL